MDVDVREIINILKIKIEDLQSRFPVHSIPATMIVELDELEGELNYWIAQLNSAEGECLDQIQAKTACIRNAPDERK
jgi:hypothetical protein